MPIVIPEELIENEIKPIHVTDNQCLKAIVLLIEESNRLLQIIADKPPNP